MIAYWEMVEEEGGYLFTNASALPPFVTWHNLLLFLFNNILIIFIFASSSCTTSLPTLSLPSPYSCVQPNIMTICMHCHARLSNITMMSWYPPSYDDSFWVSYVRWVCCVGFCWKLVNSINEYSYEYFDKMQQWGFWKIHDVEEYSMKDINGIKCIEYWF